MFASIWRPSGDAAHGRSHRAAFGGTLMRALQRAADSEASAVLTLDELERWLTDYIVSRAT
jgi:hypothetical protein